MNKLPWILLGCGLVLVLAVCLCGVLGWNFYLMMRPAGESRPVVIHEQFGQPAETVNIDTRHVLQNAEVPAHDLADLAERLEGKRGVPRTVAPPDEPFQVGAQQTFWAMNQDTNEQFQVQTTLQYVTDHAYVWIEDGVEFDRGELRDLADTFEAQIYPTNRAFFGSEWSPGVDGDPHIYLIYANNLGPSVAGYFNSGDEYTPQADEFSNAHETFYFSAENTDLGDWSTYGVLAHEFQHMIHWYTDRNEAGWLNEGFSELAALLNGYYATGFDMHYIVNPDIQLTDWPNDPNDPYATIPHYGSSFLFVSYFLDRFGETATQAVVNDPANGMDSLDYVLRQVNATDPTTQRPVGADDVFQDWTITSFLNDPAVGDGRYAYRRYEGAPSPNVTETIRSCPKKQQTRQVNQYGVDYVRFTCRGDYTLHFEGASQVGVLPADPHSGAYYFWSNKGDESDMTLTRAFDFSDQSGALLLSYWTWYDLEADYDYVYVEASLDGETWQILNTPACTTDDPVGNNYGCGYTARSGGGKQAQWVEQQVDLSAFAGQQVQIRFEYITDPAVNGEGFLLDDVSISEIGYAADFEVDDGGWQAAGFVLIQNVLPQTFRLALIKRGEQTTVEYVTLSDTLTADIPLSIGGDVDEVILIVSGTTRFTRQMAAYRFEVQK